MLAMVLILLSKVGYLHFTGMSEGATRIVADLTDDSDFEPIAAGSWERARVMETASRAEDAAGAL